MLSENTTWNCIAFEHEAEEGEAVSLPNHPSPVGLRPVLRDSPLFPYVKRAKADEVSELVF